MFLDDLDRIDGQMRGRTNSILHVVQRMRDSDFDSDRYYDSGDAANPNPIVPRYDLASYSRRSDQKNPYWSMRWLGRR